MAGVSDITQPRVSEITRGKVELLSLDYLARSDPKDGKRRHINLTPFLWERHNRLNFHQECGIRQA